MKFIPFAAAVLTGAALALTAPGARAAVKPAPESFTFAVGKTTFRSDTAGAPQADFVIVGPPQPFFSIHASSVRRSKKGVIKSSSIRMNINAAKDPRVAGNIPQTYKSGFGISGNYSVTTTTDADPVGTTQAWDIDATGVVPFTLKWTKFNAVTSRLTGTFSGQMKSTAIGVRNLKVVRGKFVADVAFNDPIVPMAK